MSKRIRTVTMPYNTRITLIYRSCTVRCWIIWHRNIVTRTCSANTAVSSSYLDTKIAVNSTRRTKSFLHAMNYCRHNHIAKPSRWNTKITCRFNEVSFVCNLTLLVTVYEQFDVTKLIKSPSTHNDTSSSLVQEIITRNQNKSETAKVFKYQYTMVMEKKRKRNERKEINYSNWNFCYVRGSI